MSIKKITVAVLVLFMTVFSVSAESLEADAALEAQGNPVNAKAAIVMEAMTGRVMFAQDENERLPIASTTKIMTTLIALEQPDIDAVFAVDENAIMVEGSSMGLTKGDKASLRALATGMLLASGNDAANATAVRIAGSIPAFADVMNARAREIGLANTSFETPSGLDGENHYSTAYDLAMLSREALKNDEFAAICSQYKMRTSYGDPPYDRWLTNHNRLLKYYDGAVGIKTGFTKKAGRCLVSAATRDGVTLICVTLGCPDDWDVHRQLYDRYFSEIKVEDLSKGIPALAVPVTGGIMPTVKTVKSDKAQIPVPVDCDNIEYKITVEQFAYAPVRKGQYLGEVHIFVDGELVGRVSLTAAADVPLKHEYKESKSFFESIKDLFAKMKDKR